MNTSARVVSKHVVSPACVGTRRWKQEMSQVPLGALLGVILLSSIVLFIGSLLNGTDLKYKRFSSPSCGQGLFIIQLPYSEFCCNDPHYHTSDWACLAAYDELNHILSSVFAWTIPVIPLVLSMATDLYLGYFSRTQRVHAKRLIFNVMVFVYRTVRCPLSLSALSLLLTPEGLSVLSRGACRELWPGLLFLFLLLLVHLP
jgi:hypothetical protein